jgi:drug/metabolite transporter (DMT)-like permease
LAWRFALATALFALLAHIERKKAAAIPWRDHFRLWGLGFVFVGNALAYFSALETIPASTASLLVYTYPVIVTLLSALCGLERFTVRSLLAALLAFAGCALTAGGLTGGGPGVGLALLSALIYAIYLVLGSLLASHLPAATASSHTAQAAAVACVAWAAFRGTLVPPPSPKAWLAVFAIAALSTVVALRALLAGMARVGAVRAAVLSSFEVVVTFGLAALFLGEALGPRQLGGAALILGAVGLQNLVALRRVTGLRSAPNPPAVRETEGTRKAE